MLVRASIYLRFFAQRLAQRLAQKRSFLTCIYMLKLSHFSAIEGNLVPLSLMELNP